MSELTTRYVEDNLQLWREYADGLRRISEGTFLEPSSARPTAGGTANLTDRARDLVQLSVSHYASLLRTYADFASRFVGSVLLPAVSDAVGTSPMSTAQAEQPADAPRRVELTFTGALGETVSRSFVVANRKTEDLDVTFELSEFVREDGRSRFRAPVTFVPDRFLLPPGGEKVVECRIPLGEPFAADARYMAMVRVPGFPGVQTVLLVVPRSAPAGAPEEPIQSSAPSVGGANTAGTRSTSSSGARRRRRRTR